MLRQVQGLQVRGDLENIGIGSGGLGGWRGRGGGETVGWEGDCNAQKWSIQEVVWVGQKGVLFGTR